MPSSTTPIDPTPLAAVDTDGPSVFHVAAWVDPVIDALGHDPRSPYVERFWLAVLGPTSTLLMRHLASRFDAEADGFELDAVLAARALGLGHRSGRHSPLLRAMARCGQFKLAQRPGVDRLVVRRKLPPLTRAQVSRLPDRLRLAHDRWQDIQLRRPSAALLEQRARRLAVSLLEVGESTAEVRAQLHRWRFEPTIADAGIEWAVQQVGARTLPPPPDAA